jgi:hypothetical protein
MLETEWQCQKCDFQAILSSIEKLQHQNSCTITDATDKEDKKYENIAHKPNSQAYECSECLQILYLTPIEILKHKNLHIKMN